MTPLLRFRLWLHESSIAERLTGLFPIVAVLGVLIWAVAPASSPRGDGSASAPGIGRTAADGQSHDAVQPVDAGQPLEVGQPVEPGQPGSPGGGPVNTTGSSTDVEPASCVSGSTDAGVTDKTIAVAVIIIDMGAANQLIGLPSYNEQVRAYEAMWDVINGGGGVQCRQVVASYYRDNVLDPSQEHALCLKIEADRPFAVINNLYNPQELDCIPQRGIPNLWYSSPLTSASNDHSPYIMSFQPDYDRLVRMTVLGLHQLGWLKGAGKIGLVENSCYPELHDAAMAALGSAGVAKATVEVFNYGCDLSAAAAATQVAGPSPTDQQAVVQFQRAGVTHVINISRGNIINFTRAGDNQGYHPKYGLMDDSFIGLVEGGTLTPGGSMDGALTITTTQGGTPNTPNVAYSPATKECERILSGAGVPSPKGVGAGPSVRGIACNQAWLFAAAAARSPGLRRADLAVGFARMGAPDLSFPTGPTEITDPSNPTGGQYWRPTIYHANCKCWTVSDATFRHDFG